MGPLFIRGLASFCTIILFIRYFRNVSVSLVVVFILLMMLLGYLAFIWARRQKWTLRSYVGLSAVMVCGILFLSFRITGVAASELTSTLLWPLFWLLASAPQKQSKSVSILVMAALGAILIVNLSSSKPFNQLFGPIGMYICVMGITSLNESNRLNQQHMEELQEAHSLLQKAHHDLQEATVQSMRYAALSERTRLARDIHDGIGHHLTSLIVQLQALELLLPEQPEQAAGQVPLMLMVARKAMGEVRSVVREWDDDESGLGLIALKGLVAQCAAQSSLRLHFECDEEKLPELPLETYTTLYRVLQEALTNMMKHSEASSGCVSIEEREQKILMTVSDNGRYTNQHALTPDFGMIGMKTRCEESGGSFSYAVNLPHGMIIWAEIPLREGGRGDARVWL